MAPTCIECGHDAAHHLPDASGPNGPRACDVPPPEGCVLGCNCHRDQVHLQAVQCPECTGFKPHGHSPCFDCTCEVA